MCVCVCVCAGGGSGEDEGAVAGHSDSEAGVFGPAATKDCLQARCLTHTKVIWIKGKRVCVQCGETQCVHFK